MTPDEFTAGYHDLDVVIDAVGHPPTVLSAWRAVRRGGTVTVVGAAARARWSRFPPTSFSTTTSG